MTDVATTQGRASALPAGCPEETGTYYLLETSAGAFLDFDGPDAGTITLDDVARGLSTTVRFRGQGGFYSVAEHAVLVAEKVYDLTADAMLALAGLHHDDHEAFMGDCPTPLKKKLGSAWREIERDLDEAIVPALGLPFEADQLHDPFVKDVDNWALLFEAGRLLPSGGRGWSVTAKWDTTTSGGVLWAGCLGDETARRLWLDRHRFLMAAALADSAVA